MPNRAGQLVWDDPDAERGGLSRRRIVREAIVIADADGLEAVSIRRVAATLGARPMSLYTHVASKDDLVALMLDEVSGELLVETSPGWREALGEIAAAAFAAYRTHPWMLGVLGRGTRMGPNQLRRAEQSAAAVESLSPEPTDRWLALRVVHEWTIGHALHVLTLREDAQLRAQLKGASADEFPHVAAVFPAGDDEEEASFRTALGVVLDGLAVQCAANARADSHPES